jgi:hypothetical protein
VYADYPTDLVMQCFEYALAREQMQITMLQQYGNKESVAKANKLLKAIRDLQMEDETEAREQERNATKILEFIKDLQPGLML